MQKAIDLIKEFEGCHLDAYLPPEGDKNGWAIGYGYTRPWVRKGCHISQAWAEELLRQELLHVDSQVSSMFKDHNKHFWDLSINQQAAVLSLVYNIGVTAFAKSTLLRKLLAGDIEGAAREFPKWCRAGGKVLQGLVRRREAEMKLFLTPDEGG